MLQLQPCNPESPDPRPPTPPHPLAVVFGLTMLTAAFAAAMVWFMRWEKWSSLASALLWLDVALLMFLGTGGSAATLNPNLKPWTGSQGRPIGMQPAGCLACGH